jgi:hypothetical protein
MSDNLQPLEFESQGSCTLGVPSSEWCRLCHFSPGQRTEDNNEDMNFMMTNGRVAEIGNRISKFYLTSVLFPCTSHSSTSTSSTV